MVALAGLLAALALVYTNASGVVEVAEHARTQQSAESALGASAAARNALGHALLLSQGDFDPALSAASIQEALLVLDELDARVATVTQMIPDPGGLVDAPATVFRESRNVLDLITAGNLDAAGAAAAGPTLTAYHELNAALVLIRAGAVDAIASAAAEAGSVATASRFTVAFFVPTLAVGFGLMLVRRRRKREQLAADLERERTINRSKDQLIANLSHELRTPLTGIYTSALTIEDLGFEDREIAAELNSMIVDQSADLNRMVEDLLVSAQADAGRLSFDLRPTDPVNEIESVVKELGRMGTPVRVAAEPASVIADGGRLRQLLRNLVSNAIRHGGPDVAVHGVSQDNSYVIRVEDDGPGVPADIEERLFQRFVHQGDRPLIVGSVGLGLAITRVLAEGMGGTIDYTRQDSTTRFEIRLGIAASAAPERIPSGHAAPQRVPTDAVAPERVPSGDAAPEPAPTGDAAPERVPTGDAAPERFPAGDAVLFDDEEQPALAQVPRTSHDELDEIIKGPGLLSPTMTEAARERVASLSESLPQYTHLLTQHAELRAVLDDRSEITSVDVDAAIEEAVQTHSLLGEYQRATRSTQKESLYEHVLIACALAPKDELGYFTAAAVREPLSAIMGRPYGTPAFARHLKRFSDDVTGVLVKEGEPRHHVYRFENPSMQPYAILTGLSKGIVKESQVPQHLSGPVPDPTSPERLIELLPTAPH